MELIATYRNAGFEALADGVRAFFVRRTDLQRPGVAFGPSAEPAKISTDISLVAIDRSDPEAYALAEVILRGVGAALERYLQERPLFRAILRRQRLFDAIDTVPFEPRQQQPHALAVQRTDHQASHRAYVAVHVKHGEHQEHRPLPTRFPVGYGGHRETERHAH